MTINLKLFAILRDRAGVAEMVLELADGSVAADAAEALSRQYPALRQLVAKVAFAVNQEYVQASTILRDGDELALIPPVSGG
jgi:molybdopterin synthase catalytic subunit